MAIPERRRPAPLRIGAWICWLGLASLAASAGSPPVSGTTSPASAISPASATSPAPPDSPATEAPSAQPASADPSPTPSPAPSPTPLPTGPSSAGEEEAPPWQIPAAELGTQRLFRVRYDGPEGEGSVRLTLKLATARSYRVSTIDLLGRPVWSLSVEGDEVTWIDDRSRRACRFRGEITPETIPLAPFSLPALPALLLGRLPEEPADPPSQVPGGRLEYVDAAGHRWSVDLHAGAVLGWTRWTQGEPSAWWRTIDGEGVLSERDRGMQIRWRQVLSEPTAALPPPPEVPAEYLDACPGLGAVSSTHPD